MKARWPEVRYILCGDGPLQDEFSSTAAQLGLPGTCRVAGLARPGALMKEYAAAHLFLHPSEKTKDSDQEGIPNSMLEAMATGLPVVATLHGGIPEAVTDGHDGLLVPEHAPVELAGAIPG